MSLQVKARHDNVDNEIRLYLKIQCEVFDNSASEWKALVRIEDTEILSSRGAIPVFDRLVESKPGEELEIPPPVEFELFFDMYNQAAGVYTVQWLFIEEYIETDITVYKFTVK